MAPVAIKKVAHTLRTPGIARPTTLAVDIGGTGLKVMVLDAEGKPLCDRVRISTPRPATPPRVLAALDKLRRQVPACNRVSVGFPGVIKHAKTLTAAQRQRHFHICPIG